MLIKILLSVCGLLFTVALAGAIVGQLQQAQPTALDYAKQDAAIADLAQQQRISAFAEPVMAVLAVGWRLVPFVAVLMLSWHLTHLASVAVLRYRLERRPDAAGLLPVPVDELAGEAAQALAGYHQARLAEAQRPMVPAHLTYAPRVDYRIAGGQPGDVPALPDLAAINIPSFSQLLDRGRISQGQSMILGFDAESGQELTGSWLDLYSCGVGGLAGSGKSSTASFLLAQGVLSGASVILLDPHGGARESLTERLEPLASRFLVEPAASERDMRSTIELVRSELARRVTQGRGSPWVIAIDEYASLMRGPLAEPMGRLLEALGQEGRKLGIFALAASQVWTASRSGGSETRDSLASAYVHRCRPAQARYLTGLTAADLPGDLLDLPAGTAYLLSTAGDLRKVRLPQVEPTDLARVARMIGATEGATEGVTEGVRGAPLRPRQNATNLSADEQRIIAGFLDGRTISELASEAAGSRGGESYQRAAKQIADALR